MSFISEELEQKLHFVLATALSEFLSADTDHLVTGRLPVEPVKAQGWVELRFLFVELGYLQAARLPPSFLDHEIGLGT